MTIYDHIFIVIFVVIYPVYVSFSYRKIRQGLIDNQPDLRKKDYQLTSFWLCLLGTIAIFIWICNDRPFETLGLDFNSYWSVSISLLLTVLIVLYFFSLQKKIRGSDEQRQSLRDKLNNTDAVEFLPKNIIEFKWFILLSISAGVCEEVLFRGYLFWYFEVFDNIIITIVASSVLFGFAHAYQGWSGIIRTASMGLIVAIIYTLTGSLWIPISLHIMGDIYGGLIAFLAFEDDKQQMKI